jgi:hypothetical protein
MIFVGFMGFRVCLIDATHFYFGIRRIAHFISRVKCGNKKNSSATICFGMLECWKNICFGKKKDSFLQPHKKAKRQKFLPSCLLAFLPK